VSKRLVPAEPRSNADIEALTLELVQKYQGGLLERGEQFDIVRFFECEMEAICGVRPDYQKLGAEIQGYTDSERMVSVISCDLAEDRWQEKYYRSTVAHETGHAILHVRDYRHKKALLKSIHRKDHALTMYRETDIVLYKNPEWQAWRFAGALLMPAPAFTAAIREGLGVRDLADRFGVNPAFVRSRLRALGLPE